MKSKSANKARWQDEREEDKRSEPESYEEVKRLNRVIGQLEGIRKMVEEDRSLDDVLIQCKAVHSALKSVETRLLRRHLEDALYDIGRTEKKKSREQKIEELIDLYKPV